MKQIALSLFVIAASGGYVWEQSDKVRVDDLIGSALPADAAEQDAGQPAVPNVPAVPALSLPEPSPQSTRLETRVGLPPSATAKEMTAAIPSPAPKPAQSADRLPKVSQVPSSQPEAPASVPNAIKPQPSAPVETLATPEFAVTPAVYIPIPQPRPDYRQASARVIRAGMKASATNPVTHHFADGTYAGPVTDAYYGPMQIQASIQGGRLTALKVLKYPSDRRTSVRINRQALPMLRDEAISAQSANVDIISGATLTSRAFIQSLDGALRQASS
ncbi:FMN-binding protein [Mesorhizobium sp. VK24D]|uniref:FMN-binding protein n=1 Tax=Mesorhizobium album TaxID=3072314 RepID=A0ABU4Y3J4_9HYPH|nr:FMN-binding protein [Mesorhizobium sp. VK24D]MDX8481502.1 FMN-binding protein [Mesorhizobium sp. VK24D]